MSCPTGSTASATMASSPMPTGPPISHWPDGSSAHPTQPRRRKRPMALKVLKPTKSGTLVLAAAGVWSSSRSSNPAASRDCGPFQQSASTAHDQHAPFVIPHHCTAATPTSHRQRPRSAHSNCQRRLPPPKTQIIQHRITVPVAPTVLKTTLAALALPSFPIESQKSDQTPAPNPHSLTPAPVRNPPRFPPSRLFGRLLPGLPSRPRLAGIRKPLTIADLPALAPEWEDRPIADISTRFLH